MSLKNKLVLVIDDDPDIRTLTRKILENLGAVVTEAAGAGEALRLCDGSAPHLIIVDLQMPGRNGYDFLELRRGTPVLAAVPIMVASSLREKEAIYKALALGASDYLIKPFNATTLIQKVRKLLKDQDFACWVYPKSAAPKTTFTIGAEITKVLETGLLLESSVKIAEQAKLLLRSDRLQELGIDTCFFQTKTGASVRGVTGRYFSQVNVIGLDESILKKVRKPRKPVSP